MLGLHKGYTQLFTNKLILQVLLEDNKLASPTPNHNEDLHCYNRSTLP